MSRFIDKLKQVSQEAAQPMGFRAAKPAAKPRLLLIARLAQPDISNLVDRLSGADAALVTISKGGPGVKRLKEICHSGDDIVWGCWLENVGKKGIKQVSEAGGDFIFFPAAGTPLTILEGDELGMVLAVEASIDEGLLRTVAELPADAVLVYGKPLEETFLTWQHLMLVQRFAALVTQPLLVPVPSGVTANELQVLWETGIDGVVVEIVPGQAVGRLKELRQTIGGLTSPSKGWRGRTEATLPGVAPEAAEFIEEEGRA